MVLSGFLVAMDESRRQTEKFFGAAVFQKCCRGVGEQPTFAKQTILPASVLQLPRCLVRICNFDSHCFTLFELDSFKECNCSRENLLQNSLLRKCGLLAHTSAAFLKNCCTEKLFSLPAAIAFFKTVQFKQSETM